MKVFLSAYHNIKCSTKILTLKISSKPVWSILPFASTIGLGPARLHIKKIILIISLNELKNDKTIIVTKPNKGYGTVILNKSDYVSKLKVILGDRRTFKKNTEDLYKTIIKLEDWNNRLMDNLFKSGCICETL